MTGNLMEIITAPSDVDFYGHEKMASWKNGVINKWRHKKMADGVRKKAWMKVKKTAKHQDLLKLV